MPRHSSPPAAGPRPQYYFACVRCAKWVMVEPNQAGSKLDCACGVTNMVPSIMHLLRTEAQPPGVPQAAPHTRTPLPQASGSNSPFGTPHVACPFCGQVMRPGRIIGERYQLKWLAADQPLTLGIWAIGGVGIGHGGFLQFNRPHIYGWRCEPCGKIIVDERA